MKLLGIRAHEKGLELSWSVDEEVPDFVRGDPNRFRQILVNLVGNAIKFTEQGEVIVRVREQDRRNGFVLLHVTVQDTGLGMTAQEQERVFSSFEQADASTTRRFGGTGLGLTITTGLVELMGGTIGVDSAPGQGSTFHFTVLLEIGETRSEVCHELMDWDQSPIVVVDDNQTNLRILESMLQSWGLHTFLATNAKQAQREIEQIYDEQGVLPLLISDVHMPEIDGFTLVKEIRQTPRIAETRVLLLTSGKREEDQQRCDELGVQAHLMKPVKPSELLNALQQAAGFSEFAPNGSDSDEKEPASTLTGLEILLVEDGRSNQILAKGLLQKWGHHVTIAEDGGEALTLLEREQFDLILMDVQMPVMDGLEATRRIREREQSTGEHIPIVAMTAKAMKGDRDECLAAGMDDYVSKPIRREELAESLSRHIADSREANDADREPPTALQAAHIDWNAARANTAEDEAILREVVQESQRELQQLVGQLQQSLLRQNTLETRRIAHTIKSIGRTLGAGKLQQIAHHCEERAGEGNLAAVADRREKLMREVEAVIHELHQYSADTDHRSDCN